MNQARCTICGNAANNLTKDAELFIYECSLCSHVFAVIPADQQKKYNHDYFTKEHENWFKNPNTKLFRFIVGQVNANFGQKNIALLDVGCGNGDFLKFFYRYRGNSTLCGIDVARLFEDANISFLHGDFNTMELKQNFDVVTSLMAIEHIENPVLFTKKIFSALERDGMAVVATINSNGIIYRLAGLLKALGIRGPYERLYDHAHLQHYTNASLKKLLENCGFEVLLQRNHNFPLAALDVPKSNVVLETVYRAGVAAIFTLTSVFGGGMDQTIICRKAP